MPREAMSESNPLEQLRIDIAYYKARLADLERGPEESPRLLQGRDWLLQQLQSCQARLKQLGG